MKKIIDYVIEMNYQAIQALQPSAGNDIAEIKKNYGVLPPVWCHISKLNQVFMNLIINALHATEDHGDISISTGRNQTDVQIVVKDSGIGIKPEYLDKIFDPFFTTKPTGKGTGLGLAICYGIVDVHNGRIEAFSEGSGKGATFTVTLPLAA